MSFHCRKQPHSQKTCSTIRTRFRCHCLIYHGHRGQGMDGTHAVDGAWGASRERARGSLGGGPGTGEGPQGARDPVWAGARARLPRGPGGPRDHGGRGGGSVGGLRPQGSPASGPGRSCRHVSTSHFPHLKLKARVRFCKSITFSHLSTLFFTFISHLFRISVFRPGRREAARSGNSGFRNHQKTT